MDSPLSGGASPGRHRATTEQRSVQRSNVVYNSAVAQRIVCICGECLFISWSQYGRDRRSCRNEMHPTYPALYALRLSLNQGVGPALYKSRSFDRGAATSAVFLATIGLSLSMFSLKQMRSSHQRRLRRLC